MKGSFVYSCYSFNQLQLRVQCMPKPLTRMWRALCFSMTLLEAYSKSQFVHELPVVQVHRAEQGNAEQAATQRMSAPRGT